MASNLLQLLVKAMSEKYGEKAAVRLSHVECGFEVTLYDDRERNCLLYRTDPSYDVALRTAARAWLTFIAVREMPAVTELQAFLKYGES